MCVCIHNLGFQSTLTSIQYGHISLISIFLTPYKLCKEHNLNTAVEIIHHEKNDNKFKKHAFVSALKAVCQNLQAHKRF